MRPASLRARAAIGAVVVVGAAMLAGAVAMVALTRSSLVDNVREAAELRAEDVAAALATGAAEPGDLAVEDAEDGFIQVVDASGEVVDASAGLAGAPPVARLEDEGSTVLDDAPVGQDRFVVVAVEADSSEGAVTVLVGRALDDADEATAALVGYLAIGLPLLLALVGVLAWHLVGRALTPVAAMAGAAEEIQATDPGRRLPAPASADEIGHLASTLNAMLDRLADARQRQAAFVADAAHELRSPVSSLRQHAEVAAAHPGASTTEELAEVVRSESVRLQHLVDDLLVLARRDADAPLQRRPVDLDDVVGAVLDRLVGDPSVDRRAVSAGQVTGDPVALDRLVANLVDNARRHARTRVAVALAADGDGRVVLDVDDDGPGVPPADRRRAFDRFVRLDDARSRDTGGTGLGLAIVAAVADAHGATVALTDSPLGGARARVEFPPAVDRAEPAPA